MRIVFALLVSLVMLSGCATMIDLGEAVCDAALGGSKAGDLCAELDNLRSEESPTPTVAAPEVPAN